MRYYIGLAAVVACVAFGTEPNAKNIQLHGLFRDHAVLQTGQAIPVWGEADPGGRIEVQLGGNRVSATVDKHGRWRVELGSMEPGGPHKLTVRGETSVTIKDILIGEVWLCSGQSNMAWPVSRSKNAAEELRQADHPQIRLYTVPMQIGEKPKPYVTGKWLPCNRKTVASFSAVAYFFGREMHKELQVPIGLIHASWGGTPAEAWTTFKTLKNDERLKPIIESFEKNQEAAKDKERMAEYMRDLKRWEENRPDVERYDDPGDDGFRRGYAAPGFDDSKWPTMELPQYWEEVVPIDGALWFRKEVEIPQQWIGKELTLSLGAIDDFDVTYFNGREIGSTGKETPQFWQAPRSYSVPGKLVEAGTATIAVRVFDHFGGGGFVGPANRLRLSGPAVAGGAKSIPLSGDWRYKVTIELVPILRPRPPATAFNARSPAALYNAMIHPLAPYGIRGAIWYQGESNAGRAMQYRSLLPAMIGDWRRLWRQGDFPFLIVQLANYTKPPVQPQDSSWAELREAQFMAAELPNVDVVTAIDLGEANDIHPKNKQEVGRRLAACALNTVHGKDLPCASPIFQSMRVEGDRAILSFTNVGDGLVAKDGEALKQFAIAGDDRQFHWADAEIVGDIVVVSSAKVETPVAVRYAWANNPEGANLYNQAGLPAFPFRTDDWPLSTKDNR